MFQNINFIFICRALSLYALERKDSDTYMYSEEVGETWREIVTLYFDCYYRSWLDTIVKEIFLNLLNFDDMTIVL